MKGIAVRGSTTAWFVPAPGPDERLGSVVERAAQLYGVTADALLEELTGQAAARVDRIDAAGPHEVRAMARALGVPAARLWRHRLLDAPRWLAPTARHAACLTCWQEDRAIGRPPGFRRAWAAALRTRCPHHGTPLQRADPANLASVRARAFVEIPVNAEALKWLDCVEHVGRTLEAVLFEGAAWPADWRLSAEQTRAALLAVSLNLGADDAMLPTSRIVAPTFLEEWVHVPRHAVGPVRGDPWTAYQGIADPALRRAALWLVAWWTVPGLPDAWRPGWFSRERGDIHPDAALAAHRPVRAVAHAAGVAATDPRDQVPRVRLPGMTRPSPPALRVERRDARSAGPR